MSAETESANTESQAYLPDFCAAGTVFVLNLAPGVGHARETADPVRIAADLIAQAEHDPTGTRPVLIHGQFLRSDQLDAAKTDRTKVLLFVSPDNPSGAIYDPAEVKAIGDCWAPATIAAAVGDGRRYAEELNEDVDRDDPLPREVTAVWES